ncbi:hypothetical protein MLD38_010104 [Melastoma candidum]|uniref:Uncharacterized protein n=1 Tax=Melastoma candidum TaxID=119954 RepID=A0ACB9QZB7_9MYRT|nr:hypothetical protein MLD38_010104 [Melastoma candidum]
MGFASVSSRNIQEDDGRDPSLFDSCIYKNVDAFQPHMHGYEHEEGEYAEDNGVAAIVNAFSGSTGSRSFKSSLAETQSIPDAPSASDPEIRDSEHYGDEHHRPNSNGDDVQSGVPGGGNYEAPSDSSPEVLKQHQGESFAGNPYAFSSSASEYNYEHSQALDSTFTHMQASSPMQNLAPFSDLLPSYADQLPSALLAPAVQSGRDSDLSYLPFSVNQPMSTKYSNTASLNSSIMSSQEGLRAGSISAAQQAPQNLPTAGVANGPGYGDALNSQYKDATNLLSLQLNDNSRMWVPGGAA